MAAFSNLTTTLATKGTNADNWPMYMNSVGRNGYNAAETIINANSAPHVKQHWVYKEGTLIFSQPVEANGLIYWGSFDSYEHATDLSGHQVWSQKLGGNPTACNPAGPNSVGIVSSATVVNGVVYVGGSDDRLYALNASTGAILWHTHLGAANTNAFIWDSPLVVNNNVYIGTATVGEGSQGCKNAQGQFFKVNASTGAIENTFSAVPTGCLGAGIWGSPTYDGSDGSIYITTGNQSSHCSEPNAVGLVKLNASDLSLVSSWSVPTAQRMVSDADFGATPVLFSATINGTLHRMVGVVNKNGRFYALDRTAVNNGPLWTAIVAVVGNCPECGQGSIAPSVFDGSQLYVAGGKTTINGRSCGGSVRALNPATGGFLWQACLPATVLGALTEVSGVIALVDTPNLTLLNARTGAILFTVNNRAYGSASISNGVIYTGSTSGSLYAFGP